VGAEEGSVEKRWNWHREGLSVGLWWVVVEEGDAKGVVCVMEVFVQLWGFIKPAIIVEYGTAESGSIVYVKKIVLQHYITR
jgi:hypothetical protein